MKTYVLFNKYYLESGKSFVGVYSSVKTAKENISINKTSDYGERFEIYAIEEDTNKKLLVWEGYTIGTYFADHEKHDYFHKGELLYTCHKNK